MLFVSWGYAWFFVAFFTAYWLLKDNTARKWLILVASYGFYGLWDWRFLGLIAASTLVDYLAALGIEGSRSRHARKRWLLVSIAFNLALLGFFKYYNFFVDSLADLLAILGVQVSDLTLSIILPVGISFYTFQTLSYTFDVYLGRIRAQRHPLDFACYVAFFPQLVAGPILRATEFLPQLEAARKLHEVPFKACFLLLLVGFTKKVVIADNLDPFVDQVYLNPDGYTMLAAAGGALLFSLQMFCDFSGYSDIAIASAGLLGYRLPRNFDAPHLATNPSDYRARWHISLTGWLRDYVFIPLGGTRGGRLLAWRNIMVTNVLSGLWHGAAWTFVLWGVANGLSVILHREWKAWLPPGRVHIPLRPVLGFLVTTYFTMVVSVFFRAESLAMAWRHLQRCHGVGAGTLELAVNPLLIVAGVWFAQWAYRRWDVTGRVEQVPMAPAALLLGAGFALAYYFRAPEILDFYYFQF